MSGSWRRRESDHPRPPSSELGTVLAAIHRTDLAEPSAVVKDLPKIANCREVASYNWLDQKEPTLLVPGMPNIQVFEHIYGW